MVEKEHEARFRARYDHLLIGNPFQRGEKVYWRCLSAATSRGRRRPQGLPRMPEAQAVSPRRE